MKAYIGTYNSKNSNGIYKILMNQNGKMSEPEWFLDYDDAKCLSLYKNHLVSSVKVGENCGIRWCQIDGEDVTELDTYLCEKSSPCFIYQDETYVATAHYHENCVHIFTKENNKLVHQKRIYFGEEAKCHQIFLSSGYFFVNCLGLDKLSIFLESDFSLVREITFPEGSGPRHGVISQKHQMLYVISELSNEVFALPMKDNLPQNISQKISLTVEKQKASSAAIRLSKDENYLYTSVRGINKIVVLAINNGSLSIHQTTECGGEHPRDIILSEDSDYLITANLDSGDVCSYEIDNSRGEIGDCIDRKYVEKGSSLAIL